MYARDLLLNPAISLLGRYPKEYKSFYHKDTCMSPLTKQRQGIINDGLNKENVVHILHEILHSHKKE